MQVEKNLNFRSLEYFFFLIKLPSYRKAICNVSATVYNLYFHHEVDGHLRAVLYVGQHKPS